MTVLSSSSPPRSSRFAYTVDLSFDDPAHPVVLDFGCFSPTSATFSFVTLDFSPSSAYPPVRRPIVVNFITVPDNGSGGLAYTPVFHVSTADHIVQFYAPPDDLIACFVVSQTRGFLLFLLLFPWILYLIWFWLQSLRRL
jgi:hypothetical protein